MPSFDPQREELVHIHGDEDTGLTADVNLTKTALGHPKIRYRDLVITADVYKLPGEPLKIHLICPRCRHALQVTEGRKAIEYDPRAGAPHDGGQISIETFECTWELEADRQQFGVGLCRWKVAVDRNIARDA